MKSAQFNPRLESIRGIAAVMVAGGHALVVYPTSGFATGCTSALRTLFNGDSAVAMFFVLSGLVLGMGLQRQGNGNAREFAAYAMRRAFRIYPVLLFSTVGILLFLAAMRIWGGPHFWFNTVLGYRQSLLNSDVFPSLRAVAENLLALNSTMNLVTWTLGVEMLCSLLLPLAHYARVRLPAMGTWLVLAVAGLIALLGKWFLLLGCVKLEGAFNWSLLNFFYLFYLGYLLPIVGPKCFASIKTSRVATRIVLVIALGLLLSAERYTDTYRIVSGLGAWLVLGVLLYGCELRASRFLEWPVVRFFGRISYSFYLLHDLVLIVCARLAAHFVFDGRTPAQPFVCNLTLLAVSILLTAGLASLAHRWIELPFIQVGKQIAGKLLDWKKSPAELPVSPAAQKIPA